MPLLESSVEGKCVLGFAESPVAGFLRGVILFSFKGLMCTISSVKRLEGSSSRSVAFLTFACILCH